MTRRFIASLVLLLAALASAHPALAAGLSVRLVDGAGRPVSDAVVTLKPVAGRAPPPKVGSDYRVNQQNTTFHPFVSIGPVGATVAFPNLDPFRHHVYSFSAPKRFELKLFARDQTRSVTFDKPGIVAIGCNIHDKMSAFIFVTDTVWTTRSPASGTVRFGDTPDGAYVLEVWHPYLRAPGGVLVRRFPAGRADRVETIVLQLRKPPLQGTGGY